MALKSKLKKIGKRASGLLPDDEIEDALDRARSFVADNAGDVARAGARTVYETPILPTGQSLKQFRASYDRSTREVADPLREIAFTAGEEDFDPIKTAKRSYQTQRDTGLGEAFRARPNTLGKRVVENVIDPLNLIPVGTSLVGAKAAGVPITRALIRSAIREMAAPAAGQIGGYYAGKAVGGKTGAQIGEFAGLLAGGFGPNLVRSGDVPVPGRSRAERVPGMAIVPVDVARRQPGGVEIPDSILMENALRWSGMEMTSDGIRVDLDRFQQPRIAGEEPARGGVFYANKKSGGR